MPIRNFTGAHRFLSNFFPVAVIYDGHSYRTVEHAYQAARTIDVDWRTRIRTAVTAGEAKRLGRQAPQRYDWESIKLSVMRDLLRQKFQQSPLRGWLLDTGKQELVEGNDWHDYFWGVCNGRGENHLGRLLMDLRDEFRQAG